jgi:pimeloyl-ACP methyl ester carboxylesterase
MYVSARGLRHHLHIWGDPALVTPERPPLVLVHGWMDVGASFQFVVDALMRVEGATRYVIAPDLRGFGLSDSASADSYWFPDYLGDLDGLLRALSPDQPVDLLGHSMGGNICTLYAGVRPQRIRKLINLEGYGLPETRPDEAPARLAEWLDELGQPTTLRTYPSLAAVAQRLCANNPRLSPDKAAWLVQHWAREKDGAFHILGDPAHKRVNPVLYRKEEALACFRLITAPLLWVEGEADSLGHLWGGRYSRREFYERLALVPHVVKQVIAAAGHMLHHDQPEQLARTLHAFLAESSAEPKP